MSEAKRNCIKLIKALPTLKVHVHILYLKSFLNYSKISQHTQKKSLMALLNSSISIKPENIQIKYILSDGFGRNERSGLITHSILLDHIKEILPRTNNILKRKDILYLLGNDGVDCSEASVRIYDDNKDSFVQIRDDWKFVIEKSDIKYSLLLWVQQCTLQQKLDKLAQNLTHMEEKYLKKIEKLETYRKYDLEQLNLKFSDLDSRYDQLTQMCQKKRFFL